jgi:hypothetical protein
MLLDVGRRRHSFGTIITSAEGKGISVRRRTTGLGRKAAVERLVLSHVNESDTKYRTDRGNDFGHERRWREPDSNFWSLNRSSSAVFNAGHHRAYPPCWVFDAHLPKIRRATVLSVEGIHTLSGKPGQCQA